MASGHVNRIQKAEHMAAPTNAANVKKALANSEPSTHGTKVSVPPCSSAMTIVSAQRFARFDCVRPQTRVRTSGPAGGRHCGVASGT
jgi:hypothetical protein